MKVLQAAAAGAAFLAGANAQSSTSAYVQPNVPNGTPIPGNYTGALRPQVHFSPPQYFLNDPNGCFLDANGTWHLYYQYNPIDIVAGNQHWGHATSRDLYHWENQQIALFPPSEGTSVFSGSAIVDVNNTSGFFPDQDNGVVAIYTLNTPEKQVQEIAYSYDGGYTFIPYENNPVIDSTSTQFRDPKVIWYEDHWVMVIAFSQDFVIGIYTSPDLKEWTHASNFSHHGLLGLQYECPNMVEIPVNGTDETMYVMTFSINPGAPLGGSIMEYFPGYFNGTHFTAVDSAARIADFAKDNYAGQFFYGTPAGSDPVSIAWASNWQYTNVVPTGSEGWRSAMSLPRRHYLANITRIGWTLVQEPYDLTPVIGEELGSNDSLFNAALDVDYSDMVSNAIYFEANVTGLVNPGTYATLNFSASSPASGESVSGGYFLGSDNTFWLDRGNTNGFDSPFFNEKFSVTQLLDPSGTWNIKGVIDRSIIEVFLDRATYSATALFFPTQPLTQFSIMTTDLPEGAQVSVAVYGLESVWTEQEDEDGTVVGNVTTSAAAEKRMLYKGRFARA